MPRKEILGQGYDDVSPLKLGPPGSENLNSRTQDSSTLPMTQRKTISDSYIVLSEYGDSVNHILDIPCMKNSLTLGGALGSAMGFINKVFRKGSIFDGLIFGFLSGSMATWIYCRYHYENVRDSTRIYENYLHFLEAKDKLVPKNTQKTPSLLDPLIEAGFEIPKNFPNVKPDNMILPEIYEYIRRPNNFNTFLGFRSYKDFLGYIEEKEMKRVEDNRKGLIRLFETGEMPDLTATVEFDIDLKSKISKEKYTELFRSQIKDEKK